jgi:predicted aspartyl protease
VIVMSEAAGNVMLDSVGTMMNGGHIELLTGDSEVIAILRLSNPATQAAADGELVLNQIAEGDAVISGQATTGRIVAADGSEILLCDVGTLDSDAVIKFGTTSISFGAPVRLDSFKLSMP